MKILLPVDGSEYTKRMLAFVAAHDEFFGKGNEFIVCTAVPPIPVYAARFLEQHTLTAYYGEEAELVFGPVRKFAAQHDWNVRFLMLRGHASEEIAVLADEVSPDLIVMGSHGHSALGNVALGSVANGVLARCKTPVLLVR